jgi:hypothetical protein
VPTILFLGRRAFSKWYVSYQRQEGIQFFPQLLAYAYKNTSSLNIHTAAYLADFLCMYTGKTSSKHSEILAEHISYSSINKPMACDDRVTRILNKPKVFYLNDRNMLYK